MRYAPRRPRRTTGFTLIELLAVIAIIGILLSFIIVAAVGAARDAQERATQALIAKLDSGLGDRLEALLAQRVDPAALVPGATPGSDQSAASMNWAVIPAPGVTANAYATEYRRDFQRAGVLARYDQVRHEVPDVFVVQDTTGTKNYPLNFAMTPYLSNGEPNLDYQAVYPIGTGVSLQARVGLGVWGASYSFLAGINKNLGKYTSARTGRVGAGYFPAGYDGVNSNSNPLVDEYSEGIQGNPQVDDPDSSPPKTIALSSLMSRALTSHKHITARAESLYALLVEGQGPYGSVFNRDDFTNNEVKDTDQDGLPEFVDGWGNPLQFYRWPILYHSDVQRGLPLVLGGSADSNGNGIYTPVAPYANAFDTREQDQLDQNQELTAPAWWSGYQNTQTDPAGQFLANGGPGTSAAVAYFQTYFHQLVEPLASSSAIGSAGATNQQFWDRSIPGSSYVVTPSGPVKAPLYGRRAFFTRFLILSAGPDGQPGVPYLTDIRYNNGTALFADPIGSGQPSVYGALPTFAAGSPAKAAQWLQVESQAAQTTLNRSNDGFLAPLTATADTLYTDQLQSDGQDDITNHNLNSTAGPVQ